MGIAHDLMKNKGTLELPAAANPKRLLNRFKKGKLRIVIHFEDNTTEDYYKSLGESYFFTINKRKYIIVSKCIIIGKGYTPEIHYYFNNPCPIFFEFRYTDLAVKELIEPERLEEMETKNPETFYIINKTVVDSEALNSAFNSKFLNGIYAIAEQKIRDWFDWRILIGVGIVLVMILHFTGVIDAKTLFNDIFISGSKSMAG